MTVRTLLKLVAFVVPLLSKPCRHSGQANETSAIRNLLMENAWGSRNEGERSQFAINRLRQRVAVCSETCVL